MNPALVIGAAECVWNDLNRLLPESAAPNIEDRFTIFAANDGGVVWPGRLDHWCTLHPNELPEREQRRRDAGHPGGYVTWSIAGDVDRVLPRDWYLEGGSSGLLAASVARYLGHESIILCGVPMERQGYAVEHMHHGDGEWPYADGYQRRVPSLAKQHSWLRPCVRSMSGWTAEFFGEPDREWLS